MNLNIGKCFFLHYVPQNTNGSYPSYHLGGAALERRTTASDLGVVIHDSLKFHNQVDNACKNASRQINTIRRCLKSRNPKFLESMFKIYVRPHLEYCNQVWNPVNRRDIVAIEKVQNRFSKLLPQSRTMEPPERNRRLNLTSHETRRKRGDLIYMFKMYESGLFTPSGESRTRGQSKKLSVERTNNNIRKHSFAIRHVETWNSLPEAVVEAPSVNVFKARLDSHFSHT